MTVKSSLPTPVPEAACVTHFEKLSCFAEHLLGYLSPHSGTLPDACNIRPSVLCQKGTRWGTLKYWAGESASSLLPLPASEESLCKAERRDLELITHCCLIAQ